MNIPDENQRLSKEQLEAALRKEGKRFEEHYSWIEKHMPASFFEEVDQESILLLVYSLMGFHLNDYFSHIHLKNRAFTLSLDSPDADLRILKHFKSYGIKNYRSFVSNAPPPFPRIKAPLRIAQIHFIDEAEEKTKNFYPPDKEKEIIEQVKLRNPQVTEEDVRHLLTSLSPLFLKAMTGERLAVVLDMFFRAKSRDNCQYEARYNEDWREKKKPPPCRLFLPGAMFPNTISSIT